MRKFLMLILAAVLAVNIVPITSHAGDGKKKEKKGKENEKEDGKDEKVALDQLPAAVKAAAEDAVKGIVLTEAEKETKNGVVIYEIDGKAGGKEYELKIAADGKVLKVKEEKNDDKDGDNEDDDDDDDGGKAKKPAKPAAPPKSDF